MTTIMDSLPNWAIYLIIVGSALLATEVGYQAGTYWNRRQEGSRGVGPSNIVGASLGLLAFMLAITTGVALNRFDNRRALVLEEANALGTTYLRAGYLEEPAGSESQALLREYVDTRIDALEADQFFAAVERAEEIQLELWAVAETLAIKYPGSPLLAIYIESLNEVIDVHTKRIIAVESARMPSALWIELFLMAWLVMFLVGFSNSYDGQRQLLAMLVLALVFGGVMLMIVDLDRIRDGFLTVNQQAMYNLQQQLNAPGQ